MAVSKGIWLVIGVQAAGKSTVAECLAGSFERGIHVRGGQFYRWAVTGWVHPGPGHREGSEARRLLDLRYRLATMVADEYCDAGFTTVVQDNVFGTDVTAWLDRVHTRPRHLVVLRPSKDVVARREKDRTRAIGKVAYRPGDFTIEDLDRALDATPGTGLWLDTSYQTPEETVREILARRDEALLDPI